MRGIRQAICVLLTVVAVIASAPAQATVIEDLMKQHPLVALVNGWNTETQASVPNTQSTEGGMPSVSGTLPDVKQPSVSPDNMTVEIVPIRVPELPAQVVFALYLLGALVFYTLLVLIAQPGPSEYY